jgi:hypothetical protein
VHVGPEGVHGSVSGVGTRLETFEVSAGVSCYPGIGDPPNVRAPHTLTGSPRRGAANVAGMGSAQPSAVWRCSLAAGGPVADPTSTIACHFDPLRPPPGSLVVGAATARLAGLPAFADDAGPEGGDERDSTHQPACDPLTPPRELITPGVTGRRQQSSRRSQLRKEGSQMIRRMKRRLTRGRGKS